MPDIIRIGVLGLSHDHVWDNLAHLAGSPCAQLVAASDPNEPLTQRIAAEQHCEVYPLHIDLLQTVELDAVMIFSSNAEGAELAIEAAARGLHVLIEKPMADCLASADAMLAAARRSDVRLMINWPFAWWPQLQHALRLAHDGTIGDVWQIKYRAAHAGPEELGCSPWFCDWLFDEELNGAGGALMDYCCYGANLAVSLLGLPSRVTGIAGRLCKEAITVEDNALIAMTYPRAIATAEASWTQIGNLTSYTTAIYGTRGTLIVEPRAGGRLLLATADHPDGTPVAVPAPAPQDRNPIDHFCHGIDTGAPFHPLCADRNCRDAQAILEAGIISARSGRSVSLPMLDAE